MYRILIVNPGINVSTKRAYNELKIKNHRSKILNKVKVFNPADERLMINDFERVVFKKYPKIEKLKYDMYRNGALFALMSGSGSSVYGFFTPQKIKAAKKYFSGLGYKIFTA
jgi:4-diphosphocytidyl-2-C-methyl-D-erythritol kinase